MVRDTPTTLWQLRHDDRWVECVVRLVPVGVDVEIIVDGSPIYGQTFPNAEAALAFAESERRLREPISDEAV